MLDILLERWFLTRLARGQDLWPQFHDRYGPIILAIYRKREVHAREWRDDLYQNLLLKLIDTDYQIIRGFLRNPDSTCFGAYLRRIFDNLVIDYFRKMHTEHKHINQAEPVETFLEFIAAADHMRLGESPEERTEALIRRICSDNTDTKAYRVLVLRFMERYSVKDIAEQLELEPNNVSQYIRYYLEKARANPDLLREIVDAG